MTSFTRPTLSIIGCGKVGRALGRVLAAGGATTLLDVLTRSVDSAAQAAAFIGAGRAASGYADLRPADIFMIATGDDQIAACTDNLAQNGLLSANTIVFHCSGMLTSCELGAALERGAAVASLHPIRSFALPEQVAGDFAGTWCGVEGERRALDRLEPMFTAIGAKLVTIDPAFKTIYHSASVFASNYLVTLLHVATQAYEKAGIPADVARELMAPLVQNTAENVLKVGARDALTGPIARGDMETVRRQHAAVAGWDVRYGLLYELMGRLTANLAGYEKDPFG